MRGARATRSPFRVWIVLALLAAVGGCGRRQGGDDDDADGDADADADADSDADGDADADADGDADADADGDGDGDPSYDVEEAVADCVAVLGSIPGPIVRGEIDFPDQSQLEVLPEGFSFSYYGTPVGALHVHEDGMIQVLGEDWAQHRDFNVEAELIQPYRRELEAGGGMERVWQGVLDDVLVTWWEGWSITGGDLVYQVYFEVHVERDGTISFHYCEGFDGIDALPEIRATIGLRAPAGLEDVYVAEDEHLELDGRAFVFRPRP